MRNTYQERLDELFQLDDFPENAFYSGNIIGGRELIVYGAGEGFHWIQEIFMREYGYQPSICLDRKFQNETRIDGIRCLAPEKFIPTPKQKQDAIVVISVGKENLHAEIEATLKRMGFANILYMMDIYEIHNPFRLPEALQTQGFNYFKTVESDIRRAFALFKDTMSREIFLNILRTHMHRVPVKLPMRPREEQHFPRDIPMKKGTQRYINCGAYDGDTIRQLHAGFGKVGALACFETEPELFRRLAAYLWAHRDALSTGPVIAFPCAVSRTEGLLPFKSGGGLGSRLHPDGDVMIQTVSIDHVLPGFHPTLISMDVEGEELAALRGAEKTIQADKPDLSICIYHNPSHLWEIPLYLHDQRMGYEFYLRNYTGFTGETNLYAITLIN